MHRYNNRVAVKLKTVPFADYVVPFPVDGSALPFDVFAASFFIISRYEEYLHKETSDIDFKATDSYQYKWKILKQPIIDEWALVLKNLVQQKYPTFKFLDKKFHQQATINFTLQPDVPNGILPKTKFIFKSVFNKEQKYLSSVFDQATGIGIDNEAVVESISSIHAQPPIYFVNFPRDSKNRLNFEHSAQFLKDKPVGLFRKYTPDGESFNALKTDFIKLQKLKNTAINTSSQQLENLKLPSCYLNLISVGVTSDYSMGYDKNLGFRAGTCTPFNWYDLQLEKVTHLNVKSFVVADTTLHYLTTTDAIATLKLFVDLVKVVSGHFYSSWQLKNLSENAKFKKWKAVYLEMIKYAGS